ncbi:hypothetical protein KCP71_14795 [Salmonella enterica subsp. enterica]|nr:hypothetical protein KCP71_14795 [Salmonella enterica subsp. enterica]
MKGVLKGYRCRPAPGGGIIGSSAPVKALRCINFLRKARRGRDYRERSRTLNVWCATERA